jgi:hypothetical protein
LPSAQFTRIVTGGHSLYAALKSGSYRVFNCGFLDLSPGAGEWGRGRLTVSPRNLRLEVRFSGVSIFSLAERWIYALTAWKNRKY